MIRRGCQCVTLSLTSRMQRLCVESWTVGLLYRCWEQLLLTKETLRCGHERFSVEEMSLRFTSVQHHYHIKTVHRTTMLDWCVLVRAGLREREGERHLCMCTTQWSIILNDKFAYSLSFFLSLSVTLSQMQ